MIWAGGVLGRLKVARSAPASVKMVSVHSIRGIYKIRGSRSRHQYANGDERSRNLSSRGPSQRFGEVVAYGERPMRDSDSR